MPIDTSATAASIAAADERLKNLSMLCGMLAGGLDRARRDLRQISADAALPQSQEAKGHAPAAGEISADMLG
jgi:hypothetical protein